jgi:hypothetical protein
MSYFGLNQSNQNQLSETAASSPIGLKSDVGFSIMLWVPVYQVCIRALWPNRISYFGRGWIKLFPSVPVY